MKNAYNVALADWFHPSAIHRIGRYGIAVRTWATDDVQVAGVQVSVLNENGEIVEQGEALQRRGPLFHHTDSVFGLLCLVQGQVGIL